MEQKRQGFKEARLKKLAEPFNEKFLLVEDQKPLAPESGSGRARYSSPTLEIIRKEIGEGRKIDPPQPILRRKGENTEQALNRYLADIKHPLVRHRLVLFRRLMSQLAAEYGGLNRAGSRPQPCSWPESKKRTEQTQRTISKRPRGRPRTAFLQQRIGFTKSNSTLPTLAGGERSLPVLPTNH